MAESNSRWPAYARVPPFLPVPLRARADGWTVERQARFIGLLAESGSVADAARRVGMSREAAWRLRRRPRAESFAHAWDTVIALHRGAARDGEALPRRKVTPGELRGLAFDGAFHVTMRRRKFIRALRKPSDSALLRLVRPIYAADARREWRQ